ncbi:outer membrane biogenesis protein BamB [Polystyrenella longa]|uniref:Outer membrane biogenesis protein BamB n=1 Tax=Polystyrenella longa TaxID=2528007 RepID=A0A518CJ11_9PLAN|nr:PQQ-binding-like beta-propeller repeat protein [Polystyrenella longa]QDU79215.1 outer membrane biogenesis protein BamB [Polystyrenella longa]
MIRLCFAVCLFVCCCSATTQAEDWPHWLGPQGDSIWRESGIVKEFPAEGPKVLWRTPIGEGYSGPAVAQGYVIVTDYVSDSGPSHYEGTQRDKRTGKERILALSESTGEIVWKHEYDCPYNISYGAGPRSTPAIEGNRVYSVGAMGDLKCLSLDKGEVIWEVDFKKKYYDRPAHWGSCTHPLLHNDMLFCIVGGEGSIAVAFDKTTGKEIWKSLSASDIGYSSPAITQAGGVEQLIILSGDSVNGLNPKSGEVYWTHPFDTIYGLAVITPRVKNHYLFVAGTPQKSEMLQLNKDKPAVEQLWEGNGRLGISAQSSIPFMEGDFMYGVNGNAAFVCFDVKTGDHLWSTYEPTTGERSKKGATAFAVKQEDRFFLFNSEGDLIIANLNPESYQELDRTHLIDPGPSTNGMQMVWCHPAFANKNIYVRNHEEIIGVSLAK